MFYNLNNNSLKCSTLCMAARVLLPSLADARATFLPEKGFFCGPSGTPVPTVGVWRQVAQIHPRLFVKLFDLLFTVRVI